MSERQNQSMAALRERLDFMRMDPAASERIRTLKTLVDAHLPSALDLFYEQIRSTPKTKAFFATEEHISGAKRAQSGHWTAISAGNFDERYFENVRRIGRTHARIGLEPKWYIGGYALITEHLIKSILAEESPRGFFRRKREDAAPDKASALAALIKGIFLDIELSTSVYMDAAEDEARRQREDAAAREQALKAAAEAERMRAEAEVLAKERAAVAASFGAALAKLADNDLTFRMKAELPEAYAQLQDNFNAAIEQLSRAFQGVQASAGNVNSGTQEIAVASNDLSRRTEQQASTLEETAAAINQISATVQKTAEGAKETTELVARARDDTLRGNAVVQRAVEAMNRIESSSRKITEIIGVIDEIAFQTNLLALNAGVEAARAGDSGRGFAVVASEVRALAQRSASSAKEIRALVSTSTSEVSEGVGLVADTGQMLTRIEAGVSAIDKVIVDIAASAREQAHSLKEVSIAVNQMDQATQQNASMAEEVTAAGGSLAQEADQLARLIAQFRVGHDADAQIPRGRESAAPHLFRAPARSGPPEPRPPALARAAHTQGRKVVGGAKGREEWDF